MSNLISNNPLRTRADLELAAVQLIEPLIPLLSPGCARLHLGETGASFPADVAEMEGFARVLWAIVPMLAGHCRSVIPLWEKWRTGIMNGTNPRHQEYWGEVGDYDQRLVEMAVFGMGLMLAPQEFYWDLPEYARDNLYNWLDQINRHDMPKNNWIFFRILVNLGFRCVGRPYPEEQLKADVALIETHYEGDGWYFDFFDQREYYSMWAFQFYAPLCGQAAADCELIPAKAYRERAAEMADDFACWFDRSGEAVPYGRSLTYRFAQSACFAAQAFAGAVTERIGYGEIKHLLLQNMRRFVKYPIFTRDGVLTIGYHYPNLNMAEGYNSPGSPYWCMKNFLVLALPDDHPFWRAEEKQPILPAISVQPHTRMLLSRAADGSHVTAFQSGNRLCEHSHAEAKYEKFVYSSVFGFSVMKSMNGLTSGAFDSMLAVSPDGGKTWLPRHGGSDYRLDADGTACVFSPFPGVDIQTRITVCGEWHIRRHRIRTTLPIRIAEGGFAIRNLAVPVTKGKSVYLSNAQGLSGIQAILGYEEARAVIPEANTNLIEPRTVIPTLTAALAPGEHTLMCAVLGTATGGEALWNNGPEANGT